jgi:hypothetical protein
MMDLDDRTVEMDCSALMFCLLEEYMNDFADQSTTHNLFMYVVGM